MEVAEGKWTKLDGCGRWKGMSRGWTKGREEPKGEKGMEQGVDEGERRMKGQVGGCTMTASAYGQPTM
jgi:hypothetical protein